MKKYILLARSNFRKSKGQAAAIASLLFLAALMLNLWLMLATDYKQNFDRWHNRLNAEHVTLAIDGDEKEMRDFLAKTLKDDAKVSEFSIDGVMHMPGLFDYNGGEVNSELIFFDKQTAVGRPVGAIEITEEGNQKSGIYMPLLYKSDEIAIGKTVTVSIGSQKTRFTVCGFFNSVMAGSHNCSVCALVLTKDCYEKLEKSGYAPKAALCSIRLNDKAGSENYETAFKKAVSSRYPEAKTASNSYALVSQSRYISQMICSGIISAMAFFILLIALAVIASNISNYIQENMRTLGALMAAGYTSRQLAASLLLQFLGLSATAAACGVGASYCLFPYINEMMAVQTGIPYRIRFLPVPMLTSFAILCGTIALAVWLSSRRIKKTEPVVALRQGIRSHSFRRNPVPLDTARVPLSLALALKTTRSGIKQNVIICITMLLLSLIVVFSGLMTENMIADMNPFLNLIVGETAESCVNVSDTVENEFLSEMRADRRVKKIYLYHSTDVSHADGLELTATICDDFSKANNQDVVFQGRFPKYGNEIAVAAKYANEKNLAIGDEITLATGGKEASYLISGYTQISNNLGKDCLLTREGYERMSELQNESYYLNLADGVSIDEFHASLKERFGSDINAVINIEATISGAASVYVSLMKVIVIAILALSLAVIVFVLYLLVRLTLNAKKQEYGILKALGFTTGQLVFQTAASFLPAVALSSVAGLTASSFLINPLTAVFLRGIGIVTCTFAVPAGFIAVSGAGMIIFAFAAACLLSLKIRHISPCALLTGE